jgi:hypothetical protein
MGSSTRSDVRLSPEFSSDLSEQDTWIFVKGVRQSDKLNEVKPSLSKLDFCDEGGRLVEASGKLTLGQAGGYAGLDEACDGGAVRRRGYPATHFDGLPSTDHPLKQR